MRLSCTAARRGTETCEAREWPHEHVAPARARVRDRSGARCRRRSLIRRKLGMKLGKFATAIERLSVRVTDTNGPRGGIDQVCSVKVVISGLPSVVICHNRRRSENSACERQGDGMPRWVGFGVIADNLMNIATCTKARAAA